jgi:hypothetical protein
MNHHEARTSLATERYLLREMSEAEREEFERHFFDCVLCAADVCDGATVVAGLQTMKREGDER